MKKGILILLTLAMLAGIAMFCTRVTAEEIPCMCTGRAFYNGSPAAYPQVKLYTDRWCYLDTYTGNELGYFFVPRNPPPAGYYRLCVRKDNNKWQHVRFYFDGYNTTNVGNVNLAASNHYDLVCPD
jgi:hypothetical protein